MLAPHAYHFVDHVETSFGKLRARILFTDHLAYLLVLILFYFEIGFDLSATHFLRLFLLGMFLDYLTGLHMAVVILLHDGVTLVESGTLWSSTLRRASFDRCTTSDESWIWF